jgi:serine/threonine protein kinase
VRTGSPYVVEDKSTVTGSDHSEVSQPIPSIDGFEFVRELGHGGMGTVYEVRDRQLGATYALKMVRIDRFSGRMRERFRREAKAMLALDHPHIARFYAFGESSDGLPFFTMKLLAGGPLTGQMECEPRRVADVMLKVCSAVSYLHGRGMVHRDLKPQNILLDEIGEPYVSDFGLVKDWHDEPGGVDSSALTANFDAVSTPGSPDAPIGEAENNRAVTKGPLGTPSYMSPEQLRHESNQIGPATDIWALGVIMYELLCGRRPFEGHDVAEMIDAIRGNARPPSAVKPGLPVELDRIVLRCLTPEVGQRYPSVDDLAADLRRWRDADSRPRQPLWNRRNALLAFGLIGGAGAAGYFIVNRDRDRKLTPGPTDFDKLVKELKENGQAALIENGRLRFPGLSRWIGGDAPELEAVDGVLGFRHPHTRLLELANGLPFEQYRLRVEMRHAGDNNKVGVYVGRSQFEKPDGIEHCFFAVTIDLTNDKQNKQPPRTRAAVAVCRNADPDGVYYTPSSTFDNSTQNSDGWRLIEIAHSTDVSLADELFGKVAVQIDGGDPRAFDRKSLTIPGGRGARAGRGEVAPVFLPSEGLGLYVTRAKVEMRSAIISINT